MRFSDMLRNYIADAVILIVLGILCFIWPQTALSMVFRILGASLVFMGVVKILTYALSDIKFGSALCVGILQVGFGFWFLLRPHFFISFFPMVAALVLIYGALVLLSRAFAFRTFDPGFFRTGLLLGLAILVLALVIFAHPAFVADLIMQVTGFSLVAEGIALLVVLSKALG
ncbi:MAG: DUF308 domain-containing protein [Blautia sp.]|nr:DUF308 domain-containing protein [Blautia sp.]